MADYGLDEELWRKAMGAPPAAPAFDPDAWMKAMGSVPSAPVMPSPATAFGAPPAPMPLPAPEMGKPKKQTPDALLAEGQQKQEHAQLVGAEAEMQKANVLAAGAKAAADQLAERQAADEAARAKQDQDIAVRRGELEKEVTDLGNTKVDQGHLYKNASTGKLIGGAILAFLGGIQATKTGKNDVLDHIQHLIDGDVRDQMVNISNKREALGSKQTLLQQDIAMGRDASDARAKATALGYETAIKQVQAEAGKYDSPIIAARAEEMIGKLRQQQAGVIENWTQERKRTAIQGGHLALAKQEFEEGKKRFEANFSLQVNAALQAGNTAKAAALKEQQEKAIFAVSNDENGVVVAPSPTVAAELNKKVGKAMTTVSAVDRLIEIRQKIGGGGLGVLKDDERKEAESLAKFLTYDLSTLQEQGVVRDQEAPNYEAMIGDPTAWRDTVPRLKAARNRIVGDVNNSIEAQTGAKLKTRWDYNLRPPGATGGTVSEEVQRKEAEDAAQASVRADDEWRRQMLYGGGAQPNFAAMTPGYKQPAPLPPLYGPNLPIPEI